MSKGKIATARVSSASPSRHQVGVSRPDWAIMAILLLGTATAFCRVCAADFTNWDDPGNVSTNPYLNPVSLKGMLYFWRHAYMSIYIPFTYTVWGALASISRLDHPENGIWLNPWIFHTANLLVHLAAVLLAYQLLNSLTRNQLASCAGAMLFALHPVQVESVAWVAGMKDLLCGAFCVAAFWQYVLFAQRPGRRVHYVIATISFALAALLSKPSAVALPLAAAVDRSPPGSGLPGNALHCGSCYGLEWQSPAQSSRESCNMWLLPPTADEFGFARCWRARHWRFPIFCSKSSGPAYLAVQYDQAPRVLLAGKWIWFAWTIPAAIAAVALLFRKRAPWLVGWKLVSGDFNAAGSWFGPI